MKIFRFDGVLLYSDSEADTSVQTPRLFANIELSDDTLVGADLKGAIFTYGSLIDCDFQNSSFENSKMEGVSLFGSCFAGANFKAAEFYMVLALDATFCNAELQNASFIGGNWENADFSGADLTGASFIADNMGGDVSLHGANFSNANLTEVTFNGCSYNDLTVFPEGFSPQLDGLSHRALE